MKRYKVYSGQEFRKQRANATTEDVKAEFLRLSDVERKPVDWLWFNHLARGKLTLLAGNSGMGKSQMSLAFAATLTRTGKWPDGSTIDQCGSVITLSAEDGANDTIG